MLSLKIVIVLCAIFLFNFSLGRPRAPRSPRFPQFSENSVGEFVLWSCTATAQLQKNGNGNKNIIHIEPAAVEVPATTKIQVPSNPPSREDDDQISNIRIIQINTIPHRNRGRPEAVSKKSGLRNTEKTDLETKRKHGISHTVDSPLKTIKVNAFEKDMPILFKEKPLLPEAEHASSKENENPQHSSEITVIKPYDEK